MNALERLPIPAVLRRHSPVAMFLAGVAFDFLTMQRIDAWTDLSIQALYLIAIALLLVLQHRQAMELWRPSRIAARWWPYNLEVLHFLYGGLLSASVVLYVRSSTAARSTVFLILLVGVMVLNELPRGRQAGYGLRLGLYGFCLLSFLNYFVPIMLGRMGAWVFVLALALATAMVWHMTMWLTRPDREREAARVQLFLPAVGVFVLVGTLYALRLIPPVPLSVQFQGIYHDVQRDSGGYTLVYTRPQTWMVWRRDSRPFSRRNGDRVHYFTRVFAPAGFSHQVIVRWEFFDATTQAWMTTDRIPLSITGGRAEGFRGVAVKSNFIAGLWRVTAETEDGRAIATLSFEVMDDTGERERSWRVLRS
jgi:hypothetical protein